MGTLESRFHVVERDVWCSITSPSSVMYQYSNHKLPIGESFPRHMSEGLDGVILVPKLQLLITFWAHIILAKI